MNTNINNSFSPERGFFRDADTGAGGGGGGKKDDENKDGENKESLDVIDQLGINFREIVSLMRKKDPLGAIDLLKKSRELIKNYQPDSEEKLAALKWFFKEFKLKEKALYYLSDDLDEPASEEQKPEKKTETSSEKPTSEERKFEKKPENSAEKQERHQVLLERIENYFVGINKYLQVSKELGIDLTDDEIKGLISDLDLVFDEFIDPAVKTKIRKEISSKISSRSERIAQDDVPDSEKSILRSEIDELNASLQNPFTFISRSEFSNEQLDLIKKEYEKYCSEIKQFLGTKTPNEEQRIERAKKILESAEYINFIKELKKLSDESKNLSEDDLRKRYVDLMAGWPKLGIRPRIFYDVADLNYQSLSGERVSGEEVYKQYKESEKFRLNLERKLAEVDGEFKTFNFREVADEIMRRQLDLFRFQDRRNPSNQRDDRRDYLDRVFKYWAFGSVFNNEHVVAEAISSVDMFSVSLDRIEAEAKQILFKKIFEFFKLIYESQSHEAANQKNSVINEVASTIGLSRENAEKWIVEAYKKVGRVELERLEIKVELQTFFMDNVMQINQAAAGDRSQLQNCLESYLVGRNELLAASTYHPEYGWLVRKLLEDLQAIAVLRTGLGKTEKKPAEVVVKRLVRKQNLYAFSPGETGTSKFDYVEVLQRVISQPQDDDVAIAAGMPVAEYLKQKLEDMGETVVYLPDYQNNLINYENFSHSEKGRANLSTAINVLISQMENDPELKNKLDSMGKENLEKAKMFTSRLFTIFDSLGIILTEKQKNTTTRSHNGSIEDVDRISLADPEASMVHRTFRYPGNYSEPTAEILAIMSPVSAEHNLYSNIQPNKSFMPEQSYVYSELNNQGQPRELRPVHPDYIYQLGKEGDKKNGKYLRADAMQLATVQRIHWDYYEQLFPIINEMPLVRRRGFLEPLGFSTNQIIFLNQSEWERVRKAETIWDYTNGTVDRRGNVIKQIKNLDDILKPKKEYVTELQHYNTAEKNGFLGILERMYAVTSQGGRLSTEQLFSSNKSILHDWFTAWGRIKMYPSPVVRDAFVPLTYLMIRRAIVNLECVSGDTANLDEIQDAWEELINTLESNLRDGGGLDSYGAEIATVINLLCNKPVYKIVYPNNGGKQYERIRRFNFEKLGRGDYKAEEYRHLREEVGPKSGDFQPVQSRRSQKINYAISKFLYELVLKTKPYVKVPRPVIRWNAFTGKRREAYLTSDGINWKLIEDQLRGLVGDYSHLKNQLERTLRGEKGGISTGPIVSRKGDPLVQVKEDKK